MLFHGGRLLALQEQDQPYRVQLDAVSIPTAVMLIVMLTVSCNYVMRGHAAVTPVGF